MERHFDEELKELKQKLVETSELVKKMIRNAVESLKERNESLIGKVFEDEKKVNMAQIEIDDHALKLIALRQPAASDLRFIISVIKINSDLERMADLAVNIAERNKELLKEPPLKPLIDVPRMAQITQGMLEDAIKAFLEKDSELARDICKRDDTVDNLNDQIFRELLTYMLSDPKNINRAIKLILVGKYLERIADHSTNIAEDVYYIIEGKDIRHHIEEIESS
ncbi:MAG: phosphate transport system regulatory protein PhoU [Candidatus Omnitrophota bacterium]|nr:MAG: phosphate transport system regulatory protein PhoU [Candidatus Omnitrophota bacterium]RKY45167.1 MAG: phosphate transport system regulatory protein PhoU [Candidatus Omnitrophota bacterium]HDN85661.1 phosphate signaling complex protein PhoU [Candidatus Omnitrophota bacterium]